MTCNELRVYFFNFLGAIISPLILFLIIFPLYLSASDIDIEKFLSEKKNLEATIISLNKQYQEITTRIDILKSKKDLNILEEAELLNLMAKAQSLSTLLENSYEHLDNILEELRKRGIENPKDKSGVLSLRIVTKRHFEGPAELREKVLILRDKENKLLKEIERLEEVEKKIKLKEESMAFIKEQSLFDEDSVVSLIKKNVKGVSESSSRNTGGDNDINEMSYDGNKNTTTSNSFSTGSSPQDIKIRIEVTYEKSGLVNQMNIGKEKSLLIDIDLNNTSSDELRQKIELLKKIYEELSLIRSDIENRAKEVEKYFKEKKK